MKQVICAVLMLAMFSCKKKNDDQTINTTTPSKDQLVGTYRKTAETTAGQNTWNSSGGYDDCELDDTYTLNSDNTFVVTDAGTVCSPSGSGSGTWSVSGSTLTIESQPFTIVNYNGSNLVVRSTFSFGGQTVNIDETYTRQ